MAAVGFGAGAQRWVSLLHAGPHYTFVAANWPAAAGAAPLFPTRTLPQGGIALVDIPAQLTSLQAKITGRLLEPERVPWKAYFSSWHAMPLTAEQRFIVLMQQQIIEQTQ